jgi:hypothetical protein
VQRVAPVCPPRENCILGFAAVREQSAENAKSKRLNAEAQGSKGAKKQRKAIEPQRRGANTR